MFVCVSSLPGVEKNVFNLLSQTLINEPICEVAVDPQNIISLRHHWFSREMTSEKRPQKFHSDDASLPRSSLIQSEALPRSGQWRVYGIGFLH